MSDPNLIEAILEINHSIDILGLTISLGLATLIGTKIATTLWIKN